MIHMAGMHAGYFVHVCARVGVQSAMVILCSEFCIGLPWRYAAQHYSRGLSST